MNIETYLALYHYCNAWHGGQWSREYRIGCRVSKVFRPARSEEYLEILARPDYAEARHIYVKLAKAALDKEAAWKGLTRWPTSGYINCVCCSHSIVVEDALAEAGVTMCDDCVDNDCNPRESCELEHEYDEANEA